MKVDTLVELPNGSWCKSYTLFLKISLKIRCKSFFRDSDNPTASNIDGEKETLKEAAVDGKMPPRATFQGLLQNLAKMLRFYRPCALTFS